LPISESTVFETEIVGDETEKALMRVIGGEDAWKRGTVGAEQMAVSQSGEL
jgi:hypothetical protein